MKCSHDMLIFFMFSFIFDFFPDIFQTGIKVSSCSRTIVFLEAPFSYSFLEAYHDKFWRDHIADVFVKGYKSTEISGLTVPSYFQYDSKPIQFEQLSQFICLYIIPSFPLQTK